MSVKQVQCWESQPSSGGEFVRKKAAPEKWEVSVGGTSTVADGSNGTPEDQATYSWTVNTDISLVKKGVRDRQLY